MLITCAEYTTTIANQPPHEITRGECTRCISDQCAFRLVSCSSSPVRQYTRDPASYSTFISPVSGYFNFIRTICLTEIVLVFSTDLHLQQQHDVDSCTDAIDYHHRHYYRGGS